MWYRWNPTREEHYYELFRPYEKYYAHYVHQSYLDPDMPAGIFNIISDTIETYKRRDRILYILKLQRFVDFVDFWNSNKPHGVWDAKAEKVLHKYARQYQMGGGNFGFSKPISALLADFKHFITAAYANGYQSILDLQWANQNPDHLLEILKELEEEEIRTKDEVEVQANAGEIIIEFDDVYHWALLSTPEEMKVEAQAMRHCGVPTRSGSVLLSLRSPGKVGQRAHLTFEWIPLDPEKPFIPQNWGVLGEMKGYANSKPKEKYHPYIIELLLHPCIQSIIGGGYHPESNFDLSDLDAETRAELLAIKPQLKDFKKILDHKGIKETIKWITSRNKDLKDATIKDGEILLAVDIFESKGKYTRETTIDGCELAGIIIDYLPDDGYSRYGSPKTQVRDLKKYCCDGEFLDFGFDYSHIDEDRYLEILKTEEPEIYAQAIHYYKNEPFDPEYPEYFRDAAYAGEMTGWEAGTTHIMWRKLMGFLGNIVWESGAYTTEGFHIKISPEDLISHYFGDSERFSDEHYGGLFEETTNDTDSYARNLVDSRGYDQDFDEDAAKDRFLEEIPSIGDLLP